MPPKDVSSTLYWKVMDVVRTPPSGARKVSPSIKVVSGVASCSPRSGRGSHLTGCSWGSPAWPLSPPQGQPPLHCWGKAGLSPAALSDPAQPRRSCLHPCRRGCRCRGLSRGWGVVGLSLVPWEGAPGAGTTVHLVKACLCSSICPHLSIWRPPARLSSPARLFPLKSDGRPSMVHCRERRDKKGRAYWRLAGLAGPGDAACRPRSPR